MDYIFSENEFYGLLGKYRITKKELASKLNISIPTLNSRLEEQGNFTRDEIVKLFEVFSKEEVEKVLFYKKVA